MERLVLLTIFLLLGIASAHQAMADDLPDLDRIEALGKASPPDIGQFIARKLECYHWSGEEPYDRARARAIKRAVDRLKCNNLDQEEASLRKIHASSPAALKALDAASGL